jgi:membrane protein DedA with SNARE-associated domain
MMFITAFGESFVFVSLLFPGTTIMVAAGLLVPSGTLHLFPLLSGAISGAVLGDAISWWLGGHYGYLLTNRWPFTRNPQLLVRSKQFFVRFGTASVFVGRFFGPFRASIPLVAGFMKMPSLQFWAANIASAVIWAPALLVPGSLAILIARAASTSAQWQAVTVAMLAIFVLTLVWLFKRVLNLAGRT